CRYSCSIAIATTAGCVIAARSSPPCSGRMHTPSPNEGSYRPSPPAFCSREAPSCPRWTSSSTSSSRYAGQSATRSSRPTDPAQIGRGSPGRCTDTATSCRASQEQPTGCSTCSQARCGSSDRHPFRHLIQQLRAVHLVPARRIAVVARTALQLSHLGPEPLDLEPEHRVVAAQPRHLQLRSVYRVA